MNTSLLKEKLSQLGEEGGFDGAFLRRLGTWLTTAEASALHRMNPKVLAAEQGWAPQTTLDAFVHGARLGLFDFSWSMFCPHCGEIQNTDASINTLREHFFCVICQVPVRVSADDTVEVSFGLNPALGSPVLDPYADAEAYRRAFFSAAVERSPELLSYMGRIWEGFEAVGPGETLILDRDWDRGTAYRFVSAGVHSQFVFQIAPDAHSEPEEVWVDLGPRGYAPTGLTVPSLRTRFRIRNQTDGPVGLMMVKADLPALHGVMRAHPSTLKPFVTAKELLSNQRFRQLFRLQNLNPELRLNIRSLTLLFTDLKGSTELYDRTGDLNAYGLIQEHFKILGGIVGRHGGAVIKTMGDAVMASFARPLDAVRAAVDMLGEIEGVKTDQGVLELKIGLHEGPALAINNQGVLDYFGQTVNIAARVQGLAGANTLWMSEPVLKARGVGAHLKAGGFTGRRYQASLKGVGERLPVYELVPKTALKENAS